MQPTPAFPSVAAPLPPTRESAAPERRAPFMALPIPLTACDVMALNATAEAMAQDAAEDRGLVPTLGRIRDVVVFATNAWRPMCRAAVSRQTPDNLREARAGLIRTAALAVRAAANIDLHLAELQTAALQETGLKETGT